jgi:hypothetical protein
MMTHFAAAHESVCGPVLPTWALPQIGSYLGHSGRCANTVGKAARDPKATFGLIDSCARRDFLSSFKDGRYSKVAAFRAGSIVTSTVVVSRLPILRT